MRTFKYVIGLWRNLTSHNNRHCPHRTSLFCLANLLCALEPIYDPFTVPEPFMFFLIAFHHIRKSIGTFSYLQPFLFPVRLMILPRPETFPSQITFTFCLAHSALPRVFHILYCFCASLRRTEPFPSHSFNGDFLYIFSWLGFVERFRNLVCTTRLSSSFFSFPR